MWRHTFKMVAITSAFDIIGSLYWLHSTFVLVIFHTILGSFCDEFLLPIKYFCCSKASRQQTSFGGSVLTGWLCKCTCQLCILCLFYVWIIIFSQSYCMHFHRLLAWYCHLSVCLTVTLCILTKRYILQQKCLNKWMGSAPLGTWFYNLQPHTLTLSPQASPYLNIDGAIWRIY